LDPDSSLPGAELICVAAKENCPPDNHRRREELAGSNENGIPGLKWPEKGSYKCLSAITSTSYVHSSISGWLLVDS